MAAEAEFLLLLYSHPASTALPPGKGNLDQLPGEFPPSLSPDGIAWGRGAMIPPQLRLESLVPSKPEALHAEGVTDFCSE